MLWQLLIIYLMGVQQAPQTGSFFLKYDPESMVSLAGTITEVKKESWYKPLSDNYVASLKAEDGQTYQIDLGSIQNFDRKPKQGQTLSIEGSRVEHDGTIYILSRKVSIDNQKWVEVRNSKGVPMDISHFKKQQFYRMNRMRRMRKMH